MVGFYLKNIPAITFKTTLQTLKTNTMKKFNLLLFLLITFCFNGFSQAEKYNLASENLHKNVRKTIEHHYIYDENSKGFIKKSVNINNYNNDGNLIENYFLYISEYTSGTPTKKRYNYNSNKLLISTKDISDSPGKYSTNSVYTYNRKGNLIKHESIYTDGSKFYSIYINDRKGRVISEKKYSKRNKLNAEVKYSYNGNKRTETKTSYNSKDGSIIGTYTNVYNDNMKISYNSISKYGSRSSTFEYDKEGNISKTNQKSKKTTITTHDYVDDKKDNWVKKHSKTENYQYFYFREIYFENGDVTGSSQFDRIFINRHGNFANVAVVPLKKKEIKKTNYTNTNPSTFKMNKWNFDYVYLKSEIKKLVGSIEIKTTNNANLTNDSNTDFTIEFVGKKFNLNYNVNDYTDSNDMYEYHFKSDNGGTALLRIYKKEKKLNDKKLGVDFYINALFTLKEVGQEMISLYLK